MSIDRAKLLARLEAAKDQLPESVKAELASPGPGRKGVVMATLYLLGASYTQIAQLCSVKISTVTRAVKDRVTPAVRMARPRHTNKASINIDLAAEYFELATRSNEQNAIKLAEQLERTVSQR